MFMFLFVFETQCNVGFGRVIVLLKQKSLLPPSRITKANFVLSVIANTQIIWTVKYVLQSLLFILLKKPFWIQKQVV